MHNIEYIRNHPQEFDNALIKRGLKATSEIILKIDSEKRKSQTMLQKLQEERNILSKKIGESKKNNVDSSDELSRIEELKKEMSAIKELENIKNDELKAILSNIPNLVDDDVPIGDNEKSNLEIRKWGNTKEFNFKVKTHYEIGEDLGLMDFETASNISGSRFVILKGILSKLERAIAQLMLDIHTQKNGYTEINTPVIVKSHSLYGTGQLPKFEEDLFTVSDSLWLIPTAEVTLTNLVREKIINEDNLPMRFTAFTQCFRSEAGAAGKDTRGMLRHHQFSKVELVSITKENQSADELERMLQCAETILQTLNLPYRIVTLSSGDTGFASSKTYDIEVWLPSENTYREISSCSNCRDFQARRMNSRYKDKLSNSNKFVHTLNGSGLAVGRTLIAIIENYQNKDGSFNVPDALIPYMNNIKVIN
ncbi:MAG: Serine--tRNA ligase [Alphaproteobacteria bacterium MarineAlpha5_Bin11]|nr:serine--tRNA ligase [Pelagibacteraceae bacterium]PPR42581.1 MAG: Serine--tRNA ligase [Alphaproteobacteria bacterium MarineAlpha5_Bin11]|tara:strand:+ start:70 stop:1338 length:1269 start_codon:yes stop_codon:yes gene_type:complete